MTIQTLTSKQPANGLPDIDELARLANAFFTTLPGQEPATDIGNTQLEQPGPAVVAAPAPVAPASPPQVESLSGFGRRGEASYAVPQGYAAALPPSSTAPSRPAPGATASSYYFLEDATAAPATPQAAGTPPVADNRVSAESFDLPGEASLRALLAETRPVATGPVTSPPSGHYYFLEQPGIGIEKPPVIQADTRRGRRFDVEAVRRDFPILAERVNGKPLVWLDNAATTHKPQSVIDRISYFYQHENSNIHRAAHELAARATDAYEAARNKTARFLGARSPDEIIFVRGATEGINLIANTWGQQNIGAGDEIIISNLEHHANIVPWQILAANTGAKIKVIPVDDSGQIRLDEYLKLLCSKTRLVAITQVSNALGTITPVQEIIAAAHGVGAKVLVDGAQSVSHLRVNVTALDADFFVFSGHKIFAPTGIGVVYGKAEILDGMKPWQGGGNMIADVTFEKTVYQPAPNRFEAGTGNIADAVGLGAALDYVEQVGLDAISQYEHDLLVYATHGLQTVPGLRLIGTAANKASVLSFVLAGYQTEEVGKALNKEGIAVRSGHHCAQPILRRFGLEATVRPSLAFYNTCEEVDLLVSVLRRLAKTRT